MIFKFYFPWNLVKQILALIISLFYSKIQNSCKQTLITPSLGKFPIRTNLLHKLISKDILYKFINLHTRE